MKKMRKLASVLLVIAMVLGMASTAFGATVINNTEGHSYKAYQVFSGTQAADSAELASIAWGTGVNSEKLVEKFAGSEYFKNCATEADVVTVLTGGNQEAAAKEFANLAAACLTDTFVAIAAGATSVDLPAGYYLLVDVTEGLKEDARNSALLQLTEKGDVTIEAKYTLPTVDKVIVDGAEVDKNEASIGEVVNYKITGTLPQNIDDYEAYFYRFNDTLSKGLTYNGDVKVTIGETDVTQYFYTNVSKYDEVSGTTIEVAIKDLLALDLLDGVDITAATKVVVTYSATLNENAVVGVEGNPNTVDLNFSNDPNFVGDGKPTTPPETPDEPPKPDEDEPIGETPEVVVETFVTEITIEKVDEDGNPLQGAEFTLTGDGVKVVLVTREVFAEDAEGTYYKLKDGTYTTTAATDETADLYESTTVKYAKVTELVVDNEETANKVVGTVGADGKVKFTGLGAGKYTIEETKVPDGYNKAADVEFTITFDPETEQFTVDNTNVNVENNVLSTQIVNVKGIVLPETGGMGTTIFYILGAVLLLGSAVVLVTKKRMNH